MPMVNPARAVLVVLLVASGCSPGGGAYDPGKAKESFDRMREFARTRIQDPVRSEKVAALVDTYEKQIGDLNHHLQDFLLRLQALNADYDASREQFQKLAADTLAERKPLQTAVLDAAMAIKAATTPDEWKAIAKFEEEALRAGLQRDRDHDKKD